MKLSPMKVTQLTYAIFLSVQLANRLSSTSDSESRVEEVCLKCDTRIRRGYVAQIRYINQQPQQQQLYRLHKKQLVRRLLWWQQHHYGLHNKNKNTSLQIIWREDKFSGEL